MGTKIRKIIQESFIDDENGFTYQYDPVEDTITIEKTENGFTVKYLVYDSDAESPDEWSDDSLFLVHYHRQFDIQRDEVVTKDQLIEYFRAEGEEKTDHFLNDYYIFPVSALIHGGVWLRLGKCGFLEDSGGWDTSHCGFVLASKKEFPEVEKAEKAAESVVESWNQYLSGEVFGCVTEKFDVDKNSVDCDSCWGFYGLEYAKECLKNGY